MASVPVILVAVMLRMLVISLDESRIIVLPAEAVPGTTPASVLISVADAVTAVPPSVIDAVASPVSDPTDVM